MDRIEPESFGLCCPDAADVFIRREASKGLEPAGEIVCRDEITDMSAGLVVAFSVITSDGCLLDRPVHPLDLAICPGIGFGQPMLEAVSPACPVERMAPEPGERHVVALVVARHLCGWRAGGKDGARAGAILAEMKQQACNIITGQPLPSNATNVAQGAARRGSGRE